MMRIIIAVVAFVLAIPGAWAQSDRDWKICNGDDDNAAIPACTRLISTGKLTRANLSVAYYNRGLSNRRKDRLDAALADYNKAAEYNPNKADIYNNRGVVHELQRNFDLALADYARSIKINPKSPNPYSNRGDVYRKQGLFEQAIAEYQTAIRMDPKRSVDHTDLAEAYMLNGQYALALASATRAIELDSDRSAAYFDRGVSAFYMGDYRSAASDLRRAVDLNSRAYSMIYRYLARARAGETAPAELEADATRLKSTAWPYSIIEMLVGKRSPEAVLVGASGASEKCDAHYFIAHFHMIQKSPDLHAAALRNAADVCPKSDFEHMGARTELSRIGR